MDNIINWSALKAIFFKKKKISPEKKEYLRRLELRGHGRCEYCTFKYCSYKCKHDCETGMKCWSQQQICKNPRHQEKQ